MKNILISSVLIAFFCFSPFSLNAQKKAGSFRITTSSFNPKGVISAKFARKAIRGGKNISPELHWKNPPKGTKSFAIICVDMHPVAHRWIHWMVFNIPPDVRDIPENASMRKMPKGALELKNSFGDYGYGGPQPPKGTGFHKYVIAIFALKTSKIDKEPETEVEFLRAIKGKVLGKAITYFMFKHP